MNDVPFRHVPVLADRVVEIFGTVPAGVLIDATLGGAGHAVALLEARPDCRLVGLDRDADALAVATDRLARFGARATAVHACFDELGDVADRLGIKEVSGVLFDLGVSSPQLDRAERGFSYRRRGPLDMRMDRRQTRTAATVVNEYSVPELVDILVRYGDERFARRIAEAVVAARPIEDTERFAEVVRDAIPAAARRRGGHPARKAFQAVRIEVNRELEALDAALDAALAMLTPGGRLVAMSYHSGEDRLVKERFRLAATGGCECPAQLPCGCGATPSVRWVRKGAEKASPAEIEANPRAESVRLRAVEALTPPAVATLGAVHEAAS